MTPEQHARAKQLFLAACEQPADRRAAFLDHACGGDRELRVHVEDLLQHHADDERTTPALAPEAATLGAPRDLSPQSEAPRRERGFEAGTRIADRYRIVALLGQGGMGEVYRADDLVLGHTVALKFLPELFRRAPGLVERLVSEARVAHQITNPHVCRIHDIHVDATTGEVFISMEFIDGEGLGTLIRRIGRLSQDKAVEIARQLCIGLAAAHARGILHRDLKPANIMIDGHGRARLTDFGLAAPREQIAADEICAGTPGYMAPELFAGTHVSVQSDIYALGLVLYELFTGQPAFQAESLSAYARLHQRARPTPPSQLVPDLPPAIDRVIQQCLEKDPNDRPASALAVGAGLSGGDPLALAMAAGVTPSPAFVAASGARAGLPPRAATGLLAASLAVLLLVVLLAGRAGLVPDLQQVKPASVLAERARQLARELGYADAPRDRAFGFSLGAAEDFFRTSRAARGAAVAFASGGSPPRFWCRESPTSLAPASPLNLVFGHARTTLADPPRTEPGMVSLVLDHQGRLLGFEAIPPHGVGDAGARADWAPCFVAAGLNPGDFAPAPPLLEAWVPVDARLAWESRGSGDAPERIRVEAAACRGRAVLFAVLRGFSPASAPARHLDVDWRRAVALHTRAALLAVTAIGALPLAWVNVRRGRSDRRGALRLGGAVFVGRLVIWALSASHVGQVEAELRLLLFALVGAWFEASLVWLFYTALEPHVRRFWPQTIVAWSRVLAGHLRDPLVARDVLVGTLLGVCIVLLFELDRLVLGWIGWETREPLHLFYALEPLLGARYGVAACIHALLATIYLALLLVTALVLTRRLLRRTWLAGAVTVAATMPMYLPSTTHPGLSWLPLLMVLTGVLWVAARYGLIVVIGAILVSRLLLQLPLSFVPGALGWDMALFVLFVISGLAVFGFVHVRWFGRVSAA